MRNVILTLWVAMTGFALCSRACAETTNLSITFNIVSEHKFEGGRLFDAFPFPKLGYIGAKPDLTVTRLKAVSLEESTEQPCAIVDRKTGQTGKGMMRHLGRLFFTLTDEDFQRLSVLAQKPVGYRLLVRFGERPITLTRIAGSAQTPIFWTSLNTPNEAELRNLEGELRKLLP